MRPIRAGPVRTVGPSRPSGSVVQMIAFALCSPSPRDWFGDERGAGIVRRRPATCTRERRGVSKALDSFTPTRVMAVW
jgi:hypothetical protein